MHEPAAVREARALMGTVVEMELHAVPPARARTAGDAAYMEMDRLARMMNHYDAASVVSEINRCAGICSVLAPPELIEVLRMAQTLSQRSAGAFDITIGALQAWRFSGDAPDLPDAGVVAAHKILSRSADDLSLFFGNFQQIQIRFDQTASLARFIDKNRKARSARKRFDADRTRSGAQVENAGLRGYFRI